MATLLGSIIKSAVEIRGKIPNWKNPYKSQVKTLKKLLKKAEFTQFGQFYGFSEILALPDPVSEFQKRVPVHDYNSMFSEWWHKTLKGEKDVCWPGKIKFFALSSGTSEASSKHIPVSKEMLKAITRGSVKQFFTIGTYDLPADFFRKGVLMIGGSTNLEYNGIYYSGDLSGITTGNIPFWFQNYSQPGPIIKSQKDWETKLEMLTQSAKNWDIGVICGVPAWIQILMERIIEHYKLNTIHDIWPDLRIMVHGGVSIEPYRKSLNKLVSYPLIYLDTYMASEGFIAYQARPNELQAMKLFTDNGIFLEFVPFNEKNFDEDGNIRPDVEAFSIKDIEENKEYALLLSTCSGAWRYLIGDTIKLTSKKHHEIIITGRTKHFLSLCGEHLSVDNMNRAIADASQHFDVVINEFCVAGEHYENLFAHHWFIGTDKPVDSAAIMDYIDNRLRELNDDYRVERQHGLKKVYATVINEKVFIDFLASKNKLGGQSKFPRVMKGKNLNDWVSFLKKNNLV